MLRTGPAKPGTEGSGLLGLVDAAGLGMEGNGTEKFGLETNGLIGAERPGKELPVEMRIGQTNYGSASSGTVRDG